MTATGLPGRPGRLRIEPVVWLLGTVFAVVLPLLLPVPYYLSTAITALMFVALAVAFDLVVGRIGALSLCQPVFFGFGSYAAAILSTRYGWSFGATLVVSALAAVVVALAIGVPSFRLSLHAFAIATLGFATIAVLLAKNWVGLTGGPLCTTGVPAMTLFGAELTSLTAQYYVVLGLAALAVGVVFGVSRSRLGLALTAVRDDPVLAAARGLSPTAFRLAAFGLSAALSATVGVFNAYFQSVVCPENLDMSYMTALLIMVFIGGRGSLRGVVSAALLFTVLPQLLHLAEEWRLVIYGLILLAVVIAVPDGLERLFRTTGRLGRPAPPGPPPTAPPVRAEEANR
ncbi:amino acid/amide ABC transporter membrane protein 2, HAAT family [Micromonospora pallida]|uniref:Amino acid/amide ABC transporter membrane protein 2, HAAT family n=1 Tax=Micromonospora pallida TaxID=145854 RepID=A0A1C6SCF3_9ACTN|nr:branched-chain amino acid ABC transporter permease [Micromonospora pallida]SCL27137.1 amino acid/amide ABC transporter membrane protein 2, HAAT family [Micromonospora pallida]